MSDYQDFESTPYTPTAPPNSTMAIVSLVAGILSWFIMPLLGAIVGVVTGHMAKREIRDSGGTLGGDGLATAGLIISYANLGFMFLIICGVAAFFLFFGGLAIFSETSSLLPAIAMMF